jgi:hypothetical protein
MVQRVINVLLLLLFLTVGALHSGLLGAVGVLVIWLIPLCTYAVGVSVGRVEVLNGVRHPDHSLCLFARTGWHKLLWQTTFGTRLTYDATVKKDWGL